MVKKKKFKLICEICWKILGNQKLAKKIILAAKNYGAKFFKIKIWNLDNLKVEVGIKTET